MDDRLTGYRWLPLGLPRIQFLRSPAKVRISETRANVQACILILAMAFALMGVFNSRDLCSFARDLPGGWLSDQLVIGADRWHDLMLALGPAHLRPAVRELFQTLHGMSW
ncbi:MAG: hypothetical protein AB7F41_09930 [Methylocystis sp.]|uniref:hypothetical protein n=1 Tax=Methylocystis sp. TaxID=1911079 RepID=UPI003D0B48A0